MAAISPFASIFGRIIEVSEPSAIWLPVILFEKKVVSFTEMINLSFSSPIETSRGLSKLALKCKMLPSMLVESTLKFNWLSGAEFSDPLTSSNSK